MDRENRTEAHPSRITAHGGVGFHVAKDFMALGLGVIRIAEDQRGRAVGHLAGVADGDGSILAIEDGFELGEGFQSLIGSWADIIGDGFETIATGNIDGNDFGFETTSRHGFGRLLMRAESKFILFLA